MGYINWETLGLLGGMFILVSILHESGFFAWLAIRAVRRVNYHPGMLFAALLLLSAALAMFMDSITVMLFMSALTFQLCRLLKADPVAFIIAEVCAANTGGSATLVGDPPNVILGTTLGFNFSDFAVHTGPISAAVVLALLVVFYLRNRRALRDAHAVLTPQTVLEIDGLARDPLHLRLTQVGLTAFGAAVVLLTNHHWLSELTDLRINGAWAALVPAAQGLGTRARVLGSGEAGDPPGRPGRGFGRLIGSRPHNLPDPAWPLGRAKPDRKGRGVAGRGPSRWLAD